MRRLSLRTGPAAGVLALAALAWAAALAALHLRDALAAYPLTLRELASGAARELALGPQLAPFWTGHSARALACLLCFLGLRALGERALAAWLGPASPSRPRNALALGVGLGLWGYLAFALLAAGLGSRPLLGALCAALGALGAVDAARAWRASRPERPAASGAERAARAMIAGGLALAFLGTTMPEISYDALVYHLAVPQEYARAGALVPTPHSHFARLPLLASLLFYWPLALDGMSSAKLVNFGIGATLVLALYEAGAALEDRRLGLYAGALLLSTPLVLYLFWMANADLAAALFGLLSLSAYGRWRGGAAPGELRLSALLGGLALAAKYTAAFALLPAALDCAWRGSRRERALCAGLLLLPLLPWWTRNLVFAGNPVSPYLASTFGERGVDVELLAKWREETRDASPGPDPLSHVRKTWSDAVRGARDLPFNAVGPLFLGCAPFLFAGWGARWLRWGAGGFLLAYGSGLSATYITRLLLACFPPLCLVLAGALRSAAGPPLFRMALLAFLAAAAAANAAIFARVFVLSDIQGLAVATGRQTPAEFLRQPRSLYPNPSYAAFERLAALPLAPGQRVLAAGESRTFHSPRSIISSPQYAAPLLLSWASRCRTPEELLRKLDEERVGAILDNPAERARLDPPRYATPRNLALAGAALEQGFTLVYRDQWTALLRRRPSGN